HSPSRCLVPHQRSRGAYGGELRGQVHVVCDAQYPLALHPILPCVLLLAGPRMLALLTDGEHLGHGRTDHTVLTIGAALGGEEFGLRLARNPAVFEAVGMHAVCEPGALQMHIDHITDGDAPGLDSSLMPEGRIFPGAALGG